MTTRALLPLLLASTALAQPPRQLTSADYARAEKFMSYNTTPLVLHSGVRATWLPDDRFWYRTTTEKGSEAVLVDPSRATRAACDLPACLDRSADLGRGGGRGAAPRTDVLSPRMLRIIEDLAGDWRRLDERIEGLSSEIETLARQDKACERLMTVFSPSGWFWLPPLEPE